MNNEFVPRVGVVLVNFRGWRDTLLALATLFGSDYPAFDVVVVDNDSGDDSIERICSWVDGKEQVVIPSALVGLVKAGSVDDPNAFVVLNEREASCAPQNRASFTLICANSNRGFAAGNNLGLGYLRRVGQYDYFWLLNNDAFPALDALTQMVGRGLKDPTLGQIGATLIFAGRPEFIQAHGGAEYVCKTGLAYHIGAETRVADLACVQESEIERRMSYVVGASILVSEAFLSRIGLMDESYFLYFEELDWAERGKGSFGLGYARDALVYHKAGGSTQKRSRRSTLAAYYLARNRLVVTKRFHPECVTTVKHSLVYEILKLLARARWSEATGYWRALRESFRVASGDARP